MENESERERERERKKEVKRERDKEKENMSIKHVGFDKAVAIPTIVFEIKCPKCGDSFYVRVALMGIQVQCQLGTKSAEKADVKLPASRIPDFRPRTVA